MKKYLFVKALNVVKFCLEIKAAMGIKLMAETAEDVVDGHVTTHGNDVEVVIYEKNEAPNKEHKSTFRSMILNAAEEAQLTALVNAHVKD